MRPGGGVTGFVIEITGGITEELAVSQKQNKFYLYILYLHETYTLLSYSDKIYLTIKSFHHD